MKKFFLALTLLCLISLACAQTTPPTPLAPVPTTPTESSAENLTPDTTYFIHHQRPRLDSPRRKRGHPAPTR